MAVRKAYLLLASGFIFLGVVLMKNTGFVGVWYNDYPYSLIKTERQFNDITVVKDERPFNDITVVTAFFDIGRFVKGGGGKTHDPELYRKWARTFRHLSNPLVVYTDSEHFESLMRNLRSNAVNNTVIIRIDRNSSWAFHLVDKIRQVYSRKDYPKHYPNTVVPEYACAQHAKYDVTSRAATRNYFGTRFFAWLDVGYFRDILKDNKMFRLVLPSEFDENKIAATLVYNLSLAQTPDRIFKRNEVWVGGGLFLGTRDVILKYADQYKGAVKFFLSHDFMNTDQQVTYGMFSDQGRQTLKPSIHLQLFHPTPFATNWFYLGYLMKREVNPARDKSAS